jgi:hypothetical protein
MLHQGIIWECTLAFSSLVPLVKKHDDTWHFCIDYSELNQHTLQDKFPILVVDELRDVRFFTKLDLCNGYLQVRMHLDDIDKTISHTSWTL